MFFLGKSKRHPHLSDFLLRRIAQSPSKKWRPSFQLLAPAIGILATVFMVILLIGLGAITGNAVKAVMLTLGMAMAGYGAYIGYRYLDDIKPKTPEEIFEHEAHKTATHLHNLIEKRRLHRDVNPAVCSLLEEASRHWANAVATLEGPIWRNPSLPLHWQGIRDQSRLALDQAMSELLVMFRHLVPAEPGKWSVPDVVGEVIDELYPKGNTQVYHTIPAEFEPARRVAEKVKLLANAVEDASDRIQFEESEALAGSSVVAIDRVLGEMRMIQDAEHELRQNLGR